MCGEEPEVVKLSPIGEPTTVEGPIVELEDVEEPVLVEELESPECDKACESLKLLELEPVEEVESPELELAEELESPEPDVQFKLLESLECLQHDNEYELVYVPEFVAELEAPESLKEPKWLKEPECEDELEWDNDPEVELECEDVPEPL
ncbi:uncharacterized protein LOC120145161 [Hibiscus syriacus]|uniref:uncharacterized protein LOC120145161 n=1 Tax=Hibiscus syriacus TaxID=106335 RepID=UPI00192468C9|nr:uncharacterized protein LOC120145161 [Hibiscus syriacus]XP_039014984.1 uncharacterized protein LOC120145161 [Hibiscus syriacus]